MSSPVQRRLFMEPVATDGACSPKLVSERDPAKHAAEWGQKGYAVSFRYFEQDVVTVGGQEVPGPRQYDECNYYLGTLRTAPEYAAGIKEQWMRENFEWNAQMQGFTHVAVSPNGVTSPIRPNDAVVSMTGVVARISDVPADAALKI